MHLGTARWDVEASGVQWCAGSTCPRRLLLPAPLPPPMHAPCLAPSFAGQEAGDAVAMDHTHHRWQPAVWGEALHGLASTDCRCRLALRTAVHSLGGFPRLQAPQHHPCRPPPQVKYSQLIHGLKEENIQVNRKMLSELAASEPYSFKALVDQVRFMQGSGSSSAAAGGGGSSQAAAAAAPK